MSNAFGVRMAADVRKRMRLVHVPVVVQRDRRKKVLLYKWSFKLS